MNEEGLSWVWDGDGGKKLVAGNLKIMEKEPF